MGDEKRNLNCHELPVEADIPEYLYQMGVRPTASALEVAIDNLTLIAVYYLLRVGEYTCKSTQNNTKQTMQFKLEDVTFFCHHQGHLKQMSFNSSYNHILLTHSATLKLSNQKNSWKGVCIHQETNGKPLACSFRALGWQYTHILYRSAIPKTIVSSYSSQDHHWVVMDKNISTALKVSLFVLDYPFHW